MAVGARARSQLLRGIAAADVAAITKLSRKQRYAPRSVITTEGNPADHLFLLLRGSARLFSLTEDGRKVFLFSVMPGDIIGGNALLPEPTVYLASAETMTECTFHAWPRNVIRELAKRWPTILENSLGIASDYLAWYSASHLSLIRHGARTRLAQVISTLARDIGTRTPRGIALNVTNEDLASAAHMTPFTASRIMSDWQKRGALVKGRGTLLLRSKAPLP